LVPALSTLAQAISSAAHGIAHSNAVSEIFRCSVRRPVVTSEIDSPRLEIVRQALVVPHSVKQFEYGFEIRSARMIIAISSYGLFLGFHG